MNLLAKFNLMFGQDIQKALLDMLLGLVSVIPKLVTATAILIIGYIIAKLLKKIVIRSAERLGADRITDQINNMDILAKNNVTLKLSVISGKIIYYMLMLIFVMTAVGALDMPVLAELIQVFITFVPNLIAAFIILLFGLILADTLKNVVATTCKSLGMPSANIIASFVFYFVFINVIILALSQAKINTDFFAQNLSIIIAGGVLAFSIGYGFASRDLVASFLASYYTRDKLNIGDKVTLNGVTGKISGLDKSSVTVSSENKSVIIPLNKILQDNIEIHL
ncbi:MAG: mechanosensitive ion channel [Saprospiraceae bacterium]|nr:mechanosensitive ion channel [Saprospiraceae bacterium]MBL0023880.1 mechanosensitive ion channel [Saprospiraceae bacterium]